MISNATAEDLAWIRAQPEVKSARFSGLQQLRLDAATTLIGAPQVWTQVGGPDQAGRGVKIAVVDSGIDQTHPMFSDSGFTAPSGFPKFDNSTNQQYTNNKVIVAKNYVCPLTGDCTAAYDSSDRNASDGLGHGTFVASVAGGRSASTPAASTVSGVAPGVFLGNYKVFSSIGQAEDSAILTAFEDAINDGMDIISHSGGAASNGTAFLDLYSEVTQNLASLGVVTVIAAGNCGPAGNPFSCINAGDFSISSPGLLPEVITAGASTNAHTFVSSLKVLGPGSVPSNLQSVLYLPSGTPPMYAAVGPVPLLDSGAVDTTRQLCRTPNVALSLPFDHSWTIVKLSATCDANTQVSNATRAGALGLIIYDSVDEPLFNIPAFVDTGTIPSVFVTMTDGLNLLGFLNGATSVTISLNPFTVKPQTADQVAEYSSRGPTADYLIKPDLLAPGDMLGAVETVNSGGELYSPGGFLYAEGTSFATPMTSGSAAVIKQAHPTYSPHDIRSALVNTATPITRTQDGALISVMNSGGGRVNLPAAVASTLVADPAAVSFGLTTAGAVNKSANVKLKCTGTVSETFNVTSNSSVTIAGVTVATDQSNVTLAAGAAATLTVTLTATAQAQGISEGFVVLQSTSTSTTVRIPFWVMLGTPTIAAGGIVDAASFSSPVAPGEIISVFGSSIGGAPVNASSTPLPYELNHAQVLLLGRADFPDQQYGGDVFGSLPLFFTSAGQANVQLPFQMTPNRYAWILATLQGVPSNAAIFQVVQAAPAIFTATIGGTTSGVVLHANYQVVTAANPAAAGEVVIIYCTGLGDVSPEPALGAPAPGSPLSNTIANASVSVGGQAASVQFSGLAPSYVGLYQVNAQLPSGLASGPQQLSIAVAGATSKAVTTFIQ